MTITKETGAKEAITKETGAKKVGTKETRAKEAKPKTSKPKTFKLLAVAFAIIAAGTVVAIASPYLYNAQGRYALTYDSQTSPDYELMQRWVSHGVLPYVGYNNFDRHITYFGFADVMRNLLGYSVDEKFLFNSGLMYILRHEASGMLDVATGGAATTNASNNPLDFLTFRELVRLLEDRVQLFLTDEFSIDLANDPANNLTNGFPSSQNNQNNQSNPTNENLHGSNLHSAYSTLHSAIIINHLHSQAEFSINSTLSNASGHGDIIIVPRTGSYVTLQNINTTGNIVITSGGYGTAHVTLLNVSADSLHVLGEASISFVGDNHIKNIIINAPCYINTEALSRQSTVPSVASNTADLRLSGHFNEVIITNQNSFAPVIVLIDGQVEFLQAAGDLIVKGYVDIKEYNAENLRFINDDALFRQMELGQTIEDIMASLMAEMFEQIDLILYTQARQNQQLFGTGQGLGSSPTPPVIEPPLEADPDGEVEG